VRTHNVTTIFYETLVSPDVAETVANATGANTALLDPLEGLSDSSSGDNYFEVMTANLGALREGLGCT
jgi:zinc transport system substrate-binding protein